MKQKGFTMLELAVTISIIAILAAIMTPNLLKWRAGMELRGAVSDVYAAIQFGKMRAIRESDQATITLSGTQCRVTTPSGASQTVNLDNGISLATDITDSSFTFNSRGLLVDPTKSGGITISSKMGSRTIFLSPTGALRQS